jgi:hypothetical protein
MLFKSKSKSIATAGPCSLLVKSILLLVVFDAVVVTVTAHVSPHHHHNKKKHKHNLNQPEPSLVSSSCHIIPNPDQVLS